MYFSKEQIEMIRNHSKEMDETGRIPDDLLQIIYDEKLFKVVLSEELGGKMYDLPNAHKIFEESSYIDGNFGWAVTLGSGGGLFVPNFIDDTLQQVYADEKSVIAGSGFPGGRAKPVDGGYIINGTWFYSSGSQFATTFTASCFIEGKEGEIIAAAFEVEQVEVLGDWNAFGLRGTSSHSIRVTDQFVPTERMFSVLENRNDQGGNMYKFPFSTFAETSFASIVLGIGRHFLEKVEMFLKDDSRGEATERLKSTFESEQERYNIARKNFTEMVNRTWKHHLEYGEITEELQGEYSSVARKSATTTIYCADQLFRQIGMQAVMQGNDFNRIWRDLHTAGQHMFMVPLEENEAEPYALSYAKK